MGNLLEYSGIITKLRAMEARLITDEQFEEISALTSVTELVSYLNTNSSYQDVLQDMDEFFAVLQKTPYARHYNFEQDLTIEQMYEDCLYHLYTADRRQNPYSIASINMYLFLKEEELRKLTTAMECIRYGLNSGETLGYVGGKI